jgi:hypothetical protein
MKLMWNEKGLLCGKNFTWTYSVFERSMNECITPSMYRAMANYVFKGITDEELYEVEHGNYYPGDLECHAVDAYFDLPINERITLHEQELVNLRAANRLAEAKESAAIDAMLEENRPFDHTSPIDQEYNEFMRSLIDKYRKQSEDLECMMFEEENWRGGHEFDLDDKRYDPSDEY